MKRKFFCALALMPAIAAIFSLRAAAQDTSSDNNSVAMGVVMPTKVIGPTEPDGPNAPYVFANLDCLALDILPKETRLDMVDYYLSGHDGREVRNAFYGTSRIVHLTDNYAQIQLTDVSTLKIKVLHTKKGEPIVLTIYTIGSDDTAGDSEIAFYDKDLKPLKTDKYFEWPKFKDFFDIPKGSVTTIKEIEQMVPFPTIIYNIQPSSDNIVATLTVGDYMNADDYNIMKIFIAPNPVFVWNGDKYKMMKRK